MGTSSFGVSYVTVRDAAVEVGSVKEQFCTHSGQSETVSLVKKLNYTGFGAAWWLPCRSDGRVYLVDFNPRIERHACLTAVVSGLDLLREPCFVFQQVRMLIQFGFSVTLCFLFQQVTNC